MSTSPLVSIVTPSYNSGAFIEKTIQSVLNQTYADIEYIVMDGGSTDNTHEVVQNYHSDLIYISEPDRGQSDAINKGWRYSKGEIITWLCADDLYYPEAVQNVVEALIQHPDFNWVYGLADHIDKFNEPYPFRNPTLPWDYQALLNYGNYIIQPTVFIRRSLLDKIGYVREDLHYTMDYEYWLRIGHDHPALYLAKKLALVRHYPENKSMRGGAERLQELTKLVKDFGGDDLPRGFRHDWTRIYLNQLTNHVLRGQWQQIEPATQAVLRYPSHIPRAIAKSFVELLPHWVSRKMRQAIFR